LNENVYKFLESITSVDNLTSEEIEIPNPTIDTYSKEVAIIGISSYLPLADDYRQFWENLTQGLDSVRDLPDTRKNDVVRYLSNSKRFNKDSYEFVEYAYINEIDKFDYDFFKISPKEASLMDPNHRLFLEAAWSAIEDAGYGGGKIAGTNTGVFVGSISPGYSYKDLIEQMEPDFLGLSSAGNLPSFLPSRISYLLNLKGPSISVDTACSSSLVAVHMACQSIRNHESELAIAGGVKINLIPIGNSYELGIESSTSRTRTFDESSDGTGGGEGAIALLLKPLSKAIVDRDHIYGVIKGSAINNDGTSMGLTAPNPKAQEEVILKAWSDAAVNPETISYIEAHGTGTKLGDPIEIQGITNAFGKFTNKKNFCGVGSVKTNIGHLDSAAGIVGLLKAVLALKYQVIPGNLHFTKANPMIEFDNSPLYVLDQLKEWKQDYLPRRCGVSSFGFSGTNCHVVLEEAPRNTSQGDPAPSSEPNLFTLSARDKDTLFKLVNTYRSFIQQNDIDIKDLCYTLNTGRDHHLHRISIVMHSKEELLEELNCFLSNTEHSSENFITNVNSQYLGFTHPMDEEMQAAVAEFRVNKDVVVLKKISNYYVCGVKIDWEFLYSAEKRNKISLPTYPFRRDRCWVHIPDQSSEYYEIRWSATDSSCTEQSTHQNILVIKDSEISDKLIELFNIQNKNIVEVELSDHFEKRSEHMYLIGNSPEDYRKLLKDISVRNISQIIHMSSIYFY